MTYCKFNRSDLHFAVNRKCDLLKCNKESPLWRVFGGCGHSFHIECVLPDISVCKICQSTLLTKLEELGKVANEAVFTNDLRDTLDDEDETESDDEGEMDEVDTDENDEQVDSNDELNDRDINLLLQRIRRWERPDTP